MILKRVNVLKRVLCFLLGHRFVLVWYNTSIVELHCSRCRQTLPTGTIIGATHESIDQKMSMWCRNK